MEEDVRLGKSGWGGLTRWAKSLRPDPSESIGTILGHRLIQPDSDEGEERELKWKQD